MPIVLTTNQANTALSNKANRPKPLTLKVLNYLGAQKGFMLKDGRVLFLKGDTYQLITFEEFTAIAYKHEAALLENYSSKEVLAEKNNNLKNFFKLFIRHDYDYSVKSLDFIDEDVSHLCSTGVSEAELFLPLVTYLGEVLIRETGGKWDDYTDNQNNIVVVIGQNGKFYDPYVCIRKILVNNKRPYLIYSAISSQLK